MLKKITVWLLTVCMVLTLAPISAFATEEASTYQAKIGDANYETLQAAVNAAQDGDTVTLQADVTLTETLEIPAGKTITLDLNGKTISQTKEQTAGYSMIQNNGSLTINDSVGGGMISYTDTSDGTHGNVSNTISNRGTLVINGGTIKNLSDVDNAKNGYPQVIDTNSTTSDASVTINGGKLYCENYSAIRMFCNSTTYTNNVVIKDGEIYGRVDFQNPNARGNKGSLTINGGTFDANAYNGKSRSVYIFGSNTTDGSNMDLSITGGTFAKDIVISNIGNGFDSEFISGGTFTTDVSAYCAENFILQGNNGTYEVVVNPECGAVARIGADLYDTLAKAIDDAEAGDTIILQADVTLTETLEIPAGKTITLDLNGKTITGTPSAEEEYSVIVNKGDLTVKNGSIVCDHKLTGSIAYAVNTITNSGTLTIVGATIENKSTAANQIGYAIDNDSGTGNAIVIIESGKVTASGSTYYDGIRMFCRSEANQNSVTIKGGEVSSIWMQNPSDGSADRNTKDVKGSVAISGGTVSALYLEPSSEFQAAVTDGYVGSISRFETDEGRNVTGFISGGTFDSDVSAYLADDCEIVVKEDGTFGVVTIDEEGYVSAKNNMTGEYTVVKNTYFEFLGGSLRYDGKDGYDKADIRFRYDFDENYDTIEEFTALEWGWNYYAEGSNTVYTVMGSSVTTDGVTCLVLTGTSLANYEKNICVQLFFTVEIDGVSYTIYDEVQTRSIYDVATAIVADNTGDAANAYATGLLNAYAKQ